MTEIIVYRGALRDDGMPVLERAKWIRVDESHPDAVVLPASLGLGDTWWRFNSGNDFLAQLPLMEPVYDAFGTLVHPGGLVPGPVDLYRLPVLPRLVHVDYDTYRLGYEDYRQRVDPLGMEPLPSSGVVPLYVAP